MNAAVAAGALLLGVACFVVARDCLRRTGRTFDPSSLMAVAFWTGSALAYAAAARAGYVAWPAAAMLACAAVCGATDVAAGYIFDRVQLIALAAIAPALFAPAAALAAAWGALTCGGALLAVYALGRGRWLGLGDVKFAALTGLALGTSAAPAALWIACVGGGAVAAIAFATGRARRGDRMPFGAFLAGGIACAVAAGVRQ